MHYTIKKTNPVPDLNGEWNSDAWKVADILQVANFRPESCDHHPETTAKVLYSETGVHGIFQVHDKYIYSVHTNFQDGVCKDSCVEFFFRPKPDKGYFNFEMNCGGTLLCSYITDCTRTDNGFREFVNLKPEEGDQVKIYHSMPKVVDPVIQENKTWYLEFFIPFTVLENYVGSLGKKSGQAWTGNFYKCGGDPDYPHWASWSPVSELNFHLPDCFGDLTLGS